MSRYRFVLDNLDVLRFRATQELPPHESQTVWRLGVASSADKSKRGDWTRVVIATLFVEGKGGWAEMEFGAIFLSEEQGDEDQILHEIATSFAAEGLYDFARSHIRGQLSTINVTAEIPLGSPDAETYWLEEIDEGGDEASSDEVAG